jgi:class 3 adenylate cyclase
VAADEGLDRWLERNGLDDLGPILHAHAIDEVAMLAELTDDEFREIGLPIGRRKQIRRALADAPTSLRIDASYEAPEIPPAEPERRQLTVMFCDVVESTPLARRLDPEDLAALYHQYTDRCIEATERYEGHVERFLGDGVLGYFGFPQAHEDDELRAVLAGMEIVRSIGVLSCETNVDIAVRVGITTGVVVVGDLYRNVNGRVNQVVGDTTNLAARVQSAAAPGTVVVTEATRRLAGETLEYEDIGEHALKGIDTPVRLFRVVRERPAAVRFRSHAAFRDTPLVGRVAEMSALAERWRKSLAGRGQVVEIVGEAGYGKSRLAHEFAELNCPRGHVVIQCSAFHLNSPLYPMVETLRAETGSDLVGGGPTRERLEQFVSSTMPSVKSDEFVDEMIALLHGNLAPSARMTPRQRRARTMQALVSYLVDRSDPLLILVEDAHWADPSTLEVIGSMIERVVDRRVMVVITYRPEFQPAWAHDQSIVTIRVGALSSEHAESIVRGVVGSSRLSGELSHLIVTKSAGVPLFVEELTRAVVESVAVVAINGAVDPASIEVPSTLADSLLARVDRLGSAKPVSQLAAAIGQEFDRVLLADIADMADDDLARQLDRLVEADIVAPADAQGVYFFKHALIRDVAYQTMLRERRRRVHSRIADALPTIRPDEDRVRPELRARHLTDAGRFAEAIDAWINAGERAAERSATIEALSHFEHGLAITGNLDPGSEREQRELQLQVRRAGMLRVSRGFGAAETGAAYERARDLCVSLADDKHLIPALNGLYSYYLQHDYNQARSVAAELLSVACEHGTDTDLMIGHKAFGVVAFHIGDPATGVTHLSKALDMYDRDRHAGDAFVYGTDHAETAAAFLAMSLWVQAKADEALAQARWAVAHSENLNHLPSTAQALTYLCFVGVLERRPDVVDETAPRIITIAEQIAFPLLSAAGRFWAAVSMAFAGRPVDAMDDMLPALEAWVATNSHSYLPLAYACVAESHGLLGQRDLGLEKIVEGLALAERSSEVWCMAELLRVRAALLADSGAADAEVEAALRASVTLARSQGARAWELRSSTALAELLISRGCPTDAISVLRHAHHPGCSGYDTDRASELLRSLVATSTIPS